MLIKGNPDLGSVLVIGWLVGWSAYGAWHIAVSLDSYCAGRESNSCLNVSADYDRTQSQMDKRSLAMAVF